MLEAVGRSPYRAPHPHFMVTHGGCRRLITHIFVRGDQLLDRDAVFGVRESLAKHFEQQAAGTATPMTAGSSAPGRHIAIHMAG